MGVHRHALIVALLCALGCHREKSIAPDPSDRPKKDAAIDDEASIWSQTLDEYAGTNGGLVALQTSAIQPACAIDVVTKAMPTAKTETIDAFRNLVAGEPLRVTSARTPTKGFGQPEDVPADARAIVRLSAIAFDGARGDAVVYVERLSLERHGNGIALHLVRDGAGWRKMEQQICWTN